MGPIEASLQQMQGCRVYFDTNPIIYFLDRVEGYFEACLPLFQALENGDFQAYSSELCLAELLVKPLRDNNHIQARTIKNLFDEDFFCLLPHDRVVFELAAGIRATQNLKMVDALHAATAIHNNCQFLITGDKGIAKNLKGIAVVNVNEFVSARALNPSSNDS